MILDNSKPIWVFRFYLDYRIEVLCLSYVRLLPLGLSKPVKKLVQENLPDLSNFTDISEFMEKWVV